MPKRCSGSRCAQLAGRHRDGLEHRADASGARRLESSARDRAARADGRIASTRLEGINLRGVSRFSVERYTGQLLPSRRQRKQVPVAEIDHATTPSALGQQTNRNARRDKRLRAPSQRTPRQSSLSGQDRTVTYCTEIKGTPPSTTQTTNPRCDSSPTARQKKPSIASASALRSPASC